MLKKKMLTLLLGFLLAASHDDSVHAAFFKKNLINLNKLHPDLYTLVNNFLAPIISNKPIEKDYPIKIFKHTRGNDRFAYLYILTLDKYSKFYKDGTRNILNLLKENTFEKQPLIQMYLEHKKDNVNLNFESFILELSHSKDAKIKDLILEESEILFEVLKNEKYNE